ncbi:MAG: tol-pal system protein YbgF [Methylophilaceae bacterium]|nr:tol-pal system protein YbgF [Methylophilaceae bacterium]
MPSRFALILGLLLGGVSAAQAGGFFSDKQAHQRIDELKQQLAQLQAQFQAKLDEEAKQRQATEGRVSALEGQLRSQGMLELLNQVERLNGELAKLKGQLEVMAHDVETTQKRQRDLYSDLDARLRKLEGGGSVATPQAAAPTSVATPDTVPPTPPTPPVASSAVTPATAELKDYEAAHALFKSGKYAQSAEAFEKFLATHPDSKFAPNAHYWIGYAHFSQKNYKAAIAAQQKLIQKYPDHSKVPDALYNIANSQIQLGDVDGAQQTLKNLIAKYPLSDAAALAKKRLAALEALKSRN